MFVFELRSASLAVQGVYDLAKNRRVEATSYASTDALLSSKTNIYGAGLHMELSSETADTTSIQISVPNVLSVSTEVQSAAFAKMTALLDQVADAITPMSSKLERDDKGQVRPESLAKLIVEAGFRDRMEAATTLLDEMTANANLDHAESPSAHNDRSVGLASRALGAYFSHRLSQRPANASGKITKSTPRIIAPPMNELLEALGYNGVKTSDELLVTSDTYLPRETRKTVAPRGDNVTPASSDFAAANLCR
ncbi:hypothetical protein EON77_14010 [bacterium]|nr:MAG: hypothetical protein EON77_14010 [bacterium]